MGAQAPFGPLVSCPTALSLTPGKSWPLNSRRRRLAGTPLVADGTIGVVTETLGDWKWIKEAFKLRQHYNTTAVCAWCMASKRVGPLSYADFSDGAIHRNTELQRTTESDAESFANGTLPPLARIDGWQLSTTMVDFMHTDIGEFIAGSVLAELLQDP